MSGAPSGRYSKAYVSGKCVEHVKCSKTSAHQGGAVSRADPLYDGAILWHLLLNLCTIGAGVCAEEVCQMFLPHASLSSCVSDF